MLHKERCNHFACIFVQITSREFWSHKGRNARTGSSIDYSVANYMDISVLLNDDERDGFISCGKARREINTGNVRFLYAVHQKMRYKISPGDCTQVLGTFTAHHKVKY